MGGRVVGPRSPMYTHHCIHTFMLFQMPSRNSSFVRDLFLACTLSDSYGKCAKDVTLTLSVVHIILILLFLSTTGKLICERAIANFDRALRELIYIFIFIFKQT